MRSILRKAAVLTAGAAALTAALVTPASADPPGGTPTAIAAVGSDTTEYLTNDLASAYNSANPTSPTVGSWNATNPACTLSAGTWTCPPGQVAIGDPIVIKSGATSIPRPNGSSAGITELKNNANVDFARSSRGPKALTATNPDVDPLTTLPLLFVRAAQDTLQYALSGTTPTNGANNLTAAQLKTIYQTTGITWNDSRVGGTSPNAIVPMLPQAGSGTRSFFLGSIQVDDCVLGTTLPNGTVCTNGYRSDVTLVQEHDYTVIQNNADALAPFSVARYTKNVPPGAIVLDDTVTYPTAYSAIRFVYNVVRNAGTVAAPVVPASVKPFLDYICGAGASTVTADGFTTIRTCGTIDQPA